MDDAELLACMEGYRPDNAERMTMTDDDKTGPHIVVAGSPHYGFQHYGPFGGWDAAAKWAEQDLPYLLVHPDLPYPWWVVRLRSVAAPGAERE